MKKSVIFCMLINLLFINGAVGCSKKAVKSDAALSDTAYTPISASTGGTSMANDRKNAEKGQNLKSLTSEASQSARLMIYTAEITVVVEKISESFRNIKALAENIGGYMQSMSANSIVVKVPAAKFQEVISEIEKFGQVSKKEIKGTDVTEEMYDSDIRLKNAEEMRKRLLKLLERADKVEDAVKIEQELGRITETIELLKGKIRYLENQIAYSTVTVNLNSPLPQVVIKDEIPFEWVRNLANDLAKGNKISYHHVNKGSGVRFTLPKSFAKYYEDNYLTLATSAEGVFLRVQRHANSEGADPEFWTALIRRSLSGEKAIYITDIRDIKTKDKTYAKYIEGTKEVGGKKFGYLVAVALSKEYVFAYEAWGNLEQFSAEKKAVEESVKTMSISSFSFWE